MNYDYYAYTTPSYTTADIATASAITAAYTVYLIIALVVLVLQIIGMWKIFTKAGQAGWKSLIPIYNYVVLYKIIGLNPWLLLVYLGTIIPFVGAIAVLVLTIFQDIYLAKSYGKGTGFIIGLIFFTPIFYIILGFSKDAYIGPNGNPAASN